LFIICGKIVKYRKRIRIILKIKGRKWNISDVGGKIRHFCWKKCEKSAKKFEKKAKKT
jgi:hypothetical protein